MSMISECVWLDASKLPTIWISNNQWWWENSSAVEWGCCHVVVFDAVVVVVFSCTFWLRPFYHPFHVFMAHPFGFQMELSKALLTSHCQRDSKGRGNPPRHPSFGTMNCSVVTQFGAPDGSILCSRETSPLFLCCKGRSEGTSKCGLAEKSLQWLQLLLWWKIGRPIGLMTHSKLSMASHHPNHPRATPLIPELPVVARTLVGQSQGDCHLFGALRKKNLFKVH